MAEMHAHQDQQTAILRQIQQHLGLLPPPQPDLPASSEPLAPRFGFYHLRKPPQLHQRMHHLHLRLPLLDHRTSLYLIVFTYYITGDFVGTPYKRPMSLRKKKKEQSVALALKPEQGPRGIRRKSLKPGALSLDWLGVTDLNARYKGE
ncbi:hypothetical protein AAG906_029761 [Vitis piasezkii]